MKIVKIRCYCKTVYQPCQQIELLKCYTKFRLNRTVNSSISITKTSLLKLFMGITALHFEDHIKHVNTPCGEKCARSEF